MIFSFTDRKYYMSYPMLIKRIQMLTYAGKYRYTPLVIRKFCDDILEYSKSNELSKRSCDSVIKKYYEVLYGKTL